MALAWNSRTNATGSGSVSGASSSCTSRVTAFAAVTADPISTSPFTRSGAVSATRRATNVPIECPISVARGTSTASMNATTSAAS